MPEDAADDVADEFEDVTEEFYDATQNVVHVITGALKRSGRWEVDRDGLEVVGQVVYGDGDVVVYAQYEHDRGGEHAFLDRGWEIVEGRFVDAVEGTWERVTKSWK